MKKILIILFISLALQGCKDNDGFYLKSANSVDGDEKNDDGGLLPSPPLDAPPEEGEPEDGDDGGDDDDNDGPGDDDGSDDDEPGDDDGCESKPCPKKIDSSKIKDGSISIDSILCDDHKVAICHKKSCDKKSKSFQLIFVDRHAINAHLNHGKDFLINCKKLNLVHKFIIRKSLEDQCNCQK